MLFFSMQLLGPSQSEHMEIDLATSRVLRTFVGFCGNYITLLSSNLTEALTQRE